MKRILIVLIALLLAVPLMAAEKPMEITLLKAGVSDFSKVPGFEKYGNSERYFKERYEELSPGVKIVISEADISQGNSVTIDSLVAAGKAPDVYYDHISRTGKFVSPDYAIALEDYIDLSYMQPKMIEMFKRGGKTYGLPMGLVKAG